MRMVLEILTPFQAKYFFRTIVVKKLACTKKRARSVLKGRTRIKVKKTAKKPAWLVI